MFTHNFGSVFGPSYSGPAWAIMEFPEATKDSPGGRINLKGLIKIDSQVSKLLKEGHICFAEVESGKINQIICHPKISAKIERIEGIMRSTYKKPNESGLYLIESEEPEIVFQSLKLKGRIEESKNDSSITSKKDDVSPEGSENAEEYVIVDQN